MTLYSWGLRFRNTLGLCRVLGSGCSLGGVVGSEALSQNQAEPPSSKAFNVGLGFRVQGLGFRVQGVGFRGVQSTRGASLIELG